MSLFVRVQRQRCSKTTPSAEQSMTLLLSIAGVSTSDITRMPTRAFMTTDLLMMPPPETRMPSPVHLRTVVSLMLGSPSGQTIPTGHSVTLQRTNVLPAALMPQSESAVSEQSVKVLWLPRSASMPMTQLKTRLLTNVAVLFPRASRPTLALTTTLSRNVAAPPGSATIAWSTCPQKRLPSTRPVPLSAVTHLPRNTEPMICAVPNSFSVTSASPLPSKKQSVTAGPSVSAESPSHIFVRVLLRTATPTCTLPRNTQEGTLKCEPPSSARSPMWFSENRQRSALPPQNLVAWRPARPHDSKMHSRKTGWEFECETNAPIAVLSWNKQRA
mmetsp:Transcript_34549/g.106727  ORF Transcript_34549/g.106727 Transcript_34549/m.106727 type:complete len:329 (-) Transcript_34549:198-1184(-)